VKRNRAANTISLKRNIPDNLPLRWLAAILAHFVPFLHLCSFLLPLKIFLYCLLISPSIQLFSAPNTQTSHTPQVQALTITTPQTQTIHTIENHHITLSPLSSMPQYALQQFPQATAPREPDPTFDWVANWDADPRLALQPHGQVVHPAAPVPSVNRLSGGQYAFQPYPLGAIRTFPLGAISTANTGNAATPSERARTISTGNSMSPRLPAPQMYNPPVHHQQPPAAIAATHSCPSLHSWEDNGCPAKVVPAHPGKGKAW